MNAKTLFFTFFIATTLLSCTDDNSETLINGNPITGVVTYNQNVRAIINNNCVACHSAVPKNGAPMPLVTYDQVKDALLNRGLVSRISLENGNSSLMPQGGPRLAQSTIDLIVKWQNEGLLEK